MKLVFWPTLDSSLKLQRVADNWGAITTADFWDSIIPFLGLHIFHISPDNLQDGNSAIQLAQVMPTLPFVVLKAHHDFQDFMLKF